MVAQGYISEARAEEAKGKPVKLAKGTQQADREKRQRAAYFMEWLRKNFLEEEFGQELYTGGLKIYTTLDLDMQDAAEQTVEAILDQPTDPQAAVVSMTPRGEVRALVGGKDFTNTRKARGFNFATTFPGRQPGSSFKPFTLLAAIEEGISPRSRFSGHSPQFIDDPRCNQNGQPWEVSNYGGSSFGTIDLVQATTNSVNTVYAQLISEVGPDKVVDVLDDFGFNPKYGAEEIEEVCSQSLGGALDVTPLEMARAYAGFAGVGSVPHVVPIRYVTDSEDNCLKSWIGKRECEEREDTRPDQMVEENSVANLTQAMETVVQGGTAINAQIGRPVAGKTGTTQLNQNAWFSGYVPQLATAVWVGYPIQPGPDGKLGPDCGKKAETDEERIRKQNQCALDDFIPEMRFCSDLELCRPVDGREVTGGFLPAMIWGDYMEQAVAEMEVEDFPTPTEIPQEVINAPPPAPAPNPSGSASPDPDETEEPEPEPTTSQEPSPEPQPSSVPSGPPQPSPSGGGGQGGGGQGGGGQGGGGQGGGQGGGGPRKKAGP